LGIVYFYMTVSLDGFVAGPGDDVSRLFHWYFAGDTEIEIPGSPTLRVSAASAELLNEAAAAGGAMITGRRNFDLANAWGGNPPGSPCFVLTHHPPTEWEGPGSPFVFVTDGIESAVSQALRAAKGKNVEIGTPNTFQQAVNAGLLDEIRIDLAPVILGAGIRLFDNLRSTPDLRIASVVHTPEVTHLRYSVVR
jgi:dihydrofolate reductase